MNEAPGIWQLTLAIFMPLLCGLASMFVPRGAGKPALRLGIALAGPIAAIALLGLHIASFGTNAQPDTLGWVSAIHLDLALQPDQLGLFFALLVSVIGLLITVYCRAYFGPDDEALFRFLPSLMLFMTAMIGVALADNFMLLMLFWEMTAISSFLLIGWERDDPKAVKLALQAFVTTAAGGLAMLAGFILLGAHSGQWSFTALAAAGVTNDTTTTVSFGLIFAGAVAKSAQFPLHFWLPGAMAAPTPVSAYLHSATMVKAGVYLVGRMWPMCADILPLWPMLVIPIGAITMVYGAFIALQKDDLKQIFAYTTVSQLGLLMTMYGLAAFEYPSKDGVLEPNLMWDVTQILNHAMYKAPLFIIAGAIGHVASRELSQLRGFFRRDATARIMTVTLLAAAAAMAALPGTLSFTAKEFFFYQIYHGWEATERHPWFYALFAAGIATAMFNMAIFVRLAVTVLAKPGADAAPQAADAHHHDHHQDTAFWSAMLWAPGALIVSLQYVCGLVPGAYEYLFGFLEPSRHYYRHLPMLPALGVPLYMSLLGMAMGLALGFSPLLRGIFRDPLDKVFPGFYGGVTKVAGPRLFALLQSGHTSFYIGVISVTLVGLVAWTISLDPSLLNWPAEATMEAGLRTAYLLTLVVLFATLLTPIVRDRASRVLVLGTVGFAASAVFYLYQAPDLALTQISIEIVSVILFLLVLSLLPKEPVGPRLWVAVRLVIAISVGVAAFWLTLTSSTGAQPAMPHLNAQGKPYANAGEFFLRNSYEGVDTKLVPAQKAYGGVVDRGREHLGAPGNGGEPIAAALDAVTLHKGGGGNNVVNVILVDFRGLDTLGEIVVLALAALGVWTLLRRPRPGREPLPERRPS